MAVMNLAWASRGLGPARALPSSRFFLARVGSRRRASAKEEAASLVLPRIIRVLARLIWASALEGQRLAVRRKRISASGRSCWVTRRRPKAVRVERED